MLFLSFEKAMGWHDEHIQYHIVYSLLIIFPQALLFYFALIEKKKKYYQGKITWQQAFLSGGVLSLLIAGISPATMYYMHTFLSPNFLPLAIEKFVASGGDEATAQSYHSLEAYIKNAILFNVSMGIVLSAIVGVFVKTKEVNVKK